MCGTDATTKNQFPKNPDHIDRQIFREVSLEYSDVRHCRRGYCLL